MSGPGTIAINGSVSGLLTGSKLVGPLTISVSQAVAETHIVSLPIGNTSISIPSGSSALVLNMAPANNSASVVTLRGVSGDTGVRIDPRLPLVLGIKSTTTIVINTDVSCSAEVVFI